MSDINTKFLFKTMEYQNLTTEMDKNLQQKLKDRAKQNACACILVPKSVL